MMKLWNSVKNLFVSEVKARNVSEPIPANRKQRRVAASLARKQNRRRK